MAARNSKGPSVEPRWPALLAIVTTGLIYMALPEYLSVGPSWLLIALIAGLEFPAMFFLHRGSHQTNRILGFLVSGLMTAFMLWSLVVLIINLPERKEPPVEMLRSASVLWISNVVVFALWYWRLDGGGPTTRDRRAGHSEGAFLFPQMTWEKTRDRWSPRFIDYLFLSFNTSTALSPTDVPILSRWAKGLIMVQAMISLTTVVLLAARAVNIM
jgi:hypothetical protein